MDGSNKNEINVQQFYIDVKSKSPLIDTGTSSRNITDSDHSS